MEAYEHATWHRVGIHTCVCVRVLTHVCVNMCVRMTREIKIPFRITLSLKVICTLYTRRFLSFFSSGTLFFCFKYTSDIALRGSSNKRIK